MVVRARRLALLVGSLATGLACDDGAEPVVLTLGAYTTPREAYAEIVPAFRESWETRTGRALEVRESYVGSGAQARAIVGGFDADVALLSLAPDIEVIRDAGLIRRDWTATDHGGMVTRSIVVIGVRAGNPKNIRSWEELGAARRRGAHAERSDERRRDVERARDLGGSDAWARGRDACGR
jgi:sulfate transport system substrate-binding protein